MLFSHLIGHSTLKAKLIGNVREGRVAHAQFFLGPRGCGNLPLALAYARYLLCQQPGPADACGSCPSCVMLDKLAHPDLHFAFPVVLETNKVRYSDDLLSKWRSAVLEEPFLDADRWFSSLDQEKKSGLIGVAESQNILRKLSLRASQSGYKMVLIWLPERMNAEAANKLLKALEEPEPKTVFLLVGHDAERLLPTILSRMQLVKVPALEEEDVLDVLQVRHPDLSAEDARAIARRSEGDLLEALSMAEQGEEELFIFFRDWMRACYTGKVPDLVQFGEGFTAMGRERQKGLFRYGLYLVRQCMMQWLELPTLVRAYGGELEFSKRFGSLLDERRADRMRHELEMAHVHVDRNANHKLLFLDLSHRLSAAFRL